jgi:RNA polymerase sigma factor (TIGR02999 family)
MGISEPKPTADVTAMLLEWAQGDRAMLDRLIPLVYDELRRVARARLRNEPAGLTLQTTSLVHEAYVRLVHLDRMTIESRTHFFAMSARLMRQILVDHARRSRAEKRGGDITIVGLEQAGRAAAPPVDVLALDEALDLLQAMDARQCEVVELRFFAGLTTEETALALNVSRATVEREWALAKAWLYQRLTAPGG